MYLLKLLHPGNLL